MSENKLVKDYKGNLVPRTGARKIRVGDSYKYYVENISCFLMPDGQWYRIDSPKLGFDHYTQKRVLLSNSVLMEGVVDGQGTIGTFSQEAPYVQMVEKRSPSAPRRVAMTEEVANKNGYEECIGDGFYYKMSNLTAEDLKWFKKKDIPKNERSSDYNLESSPAKKEELIRQYANSVFPISVTATKIARHLGEFTFGMEVEVINGFIPKRIKEKYGLKALKDGSLRHSNQEGGGEGIEYVTMPMKGAKGVQTIMDVMKEFSKRCDVNNYCSLHFHFGNVRKDKIYVLTLWKLMGMVQDELARYFPFSRFNSIKPDGKVYCQKLDNLGIDYNTILKAKGEEDFRKTVVTEFNKIYAWMNNGKVLAEEYAPPSIHREVIEIDGKKMFTDNMYKNIYTTKTVVHAISGQKWEKKARYYLINFLNLFFNNIGTIEFRCHESTTNANKALIWLLVCTSLLKAAENAKTIFTTSSMTLDQAMQLGGLPKDMRAYIMEYFNMRHNVFYKNGTYREVWSNVEANWFSEDPSFKFESMNKYKLI